MASPRVAVVAVHGVADQSPGETARAVAELLVSSAPRGVLYTSSATEELTLRVTPLAPQAAPAAIAPATRPTPRGQERSLVKALAQSARSDFQRDAWTAPATMQQALAPRAGVDTPPAQDRGIAVTNYLLTKHVANGALPETYATTRLSLLRHGPGGAAAQVDVHEMYWADLSRLSGAMPRIVSELFTMVFRLSKLGRETVDEMWGQLRRTRDPRAPAPGEQRLAWNVLGTLQIALDWLYVNGLALLFTQLALLAIVLGCLGFASGLDESWLHRGVAIALAALGALRWIYRRGDGRWLQGLVPLAVSGLAIAALATSPALLQWITALTLLALVTAANEVALRIADDRFPLVHAVGRWMWAASAALMLASAWHESARGGATHWRDVWVHATLFSTELVLFAIKWWWIVAGVLLAVWCVAGLFAQREGGYAGRASVATGRLGVAVSLGMFLVATMSIWAMVNGVLDLSADRVGYRPCIFALQPAAAAAPATAPEVTYPPNACLVSSADARAEWAKPVPSARAVLDDRYVRSTSTFALLATLLLTLVAYLLVMFTPAVLAELKLIVDRRGKAHQEAVDRHYPEQTPASRLARTQRARALGRWLTAGYQRLDALVAAVTATGVVLSAGIGVLFLASIFDLRFVLEKLEFVEQAVTDQSQTLFEPLHALVFGAAGVGAALSLLGGALSRRIPSLRGPLDVAMDVDNHFREFPRSDIPRAHIFSRYAALLEHLRQQGYDRIVVVAHSQGTVISAELLRFLSSTAEQPPAPGDTPAIAGHVLPPVSLLTVGCPLRQLYGARFPALYAWVLARNGAVFGPRASDIGAVRWMNAFCSGDYVGRWLWSSATDAPTLSHPMANQVGRDEFGRVDAYTGFDPSPPDEALLRERREVEVCLGLGAHTHYFERDQATVAWMIDWLVRAAPPSATAPPAAQAAPLTVDATDAKAPAIVAADAAAVADGKPVSPPPADVAAGTVTPP